MGKILSVLFTMALALVAVAIASRVGFIGKIVFPAPKSA